MKTKKALAVFLAVVMLVLPLAVSSFAATKKLVFSAMGIALALVTSYLKLWNMPMGGSVTLLSMLFISLIGYWFGARYGIATGAAFGILQFIINPYMLSFPQVILDYPLAFGALGFSGFFKNHRYACSVRNFNKRNTLHLFHLRP